MDSAMRRAQAYKYESFVCLEEVLRLGSGNAVKSVLWQTRANAVTELGQPRTIWCYFHPCLHRLFCSSPELGRSPIDSSASSPSLQGHRAIPEPRETSRLSKERFPAAMEGVMFAAGERCCSWQQSLWDGASDSGH